MLVFEGDGILNSLINKLLNFTYLAISTVDLVQNWKNVLIVEIRASTPWTLLVNNTIFLTGRISLSKNDTKPIILEDKAWARVKSKDASLGEKAAALLVTGGMKVKRKLGMGCRRKRRSLHRDVILKVGKSLKRGTSMKDTATFALRAAKALIKEFGGKKEVEVPRVMPVAKSGGFLPLIPLFASLSALGALSGGAAGIAKTVIDAKHAQKKL
ncbi:uncharacterized protein LOC130450118 [Diorhabda sublineata]|uniref:uncharacterized protein LOC130450118 n=1 Tax=Diorhabda sublineata TaxID=1163346 RepID=UPI0024E16D9A|nr:uncharacterized protein LOC130450118 [Diorhabda sublineata]